MIKWSKILIILIFFNYLNSADKRHIDKREQLYKLREIEEKQFILNIKNKQKKLMESIVAELKKEYSDEYINKVLETYAEKKFDQLEEFLNFMIEKFKQTPLASFSQEVEKFLKIFSNTNLKNLILSKRLARFLRYETVQYEKNKNEYIRKFRHFISLGADVNYFFIEGPYETFISKPIFKFIHMPFNEVIQIALDNGLSINQEYQFDRTVFRGLLANSTADQIKEIIDKYSPDLNILNIIGRSPIFDLVLNSDNLFSEYQLKMNDELAKKIYVLLIAGADPNIKDEFGKTFAEYSDAPFIIELIKDQVAAKRKAEIAKHTHLPNVVTDIVQSYLG